MTTQAKIFMAGSWIFVLGLTFWCFYRLMQGKRHFDPDGIGPASPPEPARTEREARKGSNR